MNTLTAVVRLLRPVHWVKNIFVFAALVFAEKNMLGNIDKVLCSVYAFAAFCLISSFAYVLNDIKDAPMDRMHPRKCRRPIASGAVSPSLGWAIAAMLCVGGMGMGFGFSLPLGLVCLAYLVLTLAYSTFLKHRVIIDVMCLAGGFVLRAMAGVMAIEVKLSPWLIICTFTLCLFVGFGKRRCELAIADDRHDVAQNRRPVMASYTKELLSHLLTLSAAVAVMTFLLYTMDPATSEKFGTNYLIYTVPLVMYAIFRFTVLIEKGMFDGPLELFVGDRPFQATIGLWLVAVALIVHHGRSLSSFLHRLNNLY
jgi:4-hydroxybenzoate polyprenyltransferase